MKYGRRVEAILNVLGRDSLLQEIDRDEGVRNGRRRGRARDRENPTSPKNIYEGILRIISFVSVS